MSFNKKFSAVIFKLFLLVVSFTTYAGGPIGADLSINFNQSTIGPGSNSRLNFIFTSIEAGIVTDIAVTDVLPAGVTISNPASAISDCNGVSISAPDGGGTISISGISLGPSSSCSANVNVTSNTLGVHVNTTGDITSSSGTGNTASANLTVDASLPGFTKSFSPSTVSLGSPSALTFTIDNSLNGANLTFVQFADSFPAGMVIATPANASTTCGGLTVTLNALSGTDQLSFQSFGADFAGFESVAAGATCTVTVDVVAGSVGELVNQSSDMEVRVGNSFINVSNGFAADTLNVAIQTVIFSKDFIDDPVVPGATGILRFTILNRDRDNPTSNMAFTDDLDSVLTGLVATGLPQPDVCGVGSLLSGTGLISLTGGNIPPEGSCSFDINVQVPQTAIPGQYINTTSNITGDLGAGGFSSSPAVADLFVEPTPILTKNFLEFGSLGPDPIVNPGDDVVLEFTVTNTSTTSSATDIEFTDLLSIIMPTASVTPGNGCCGAGSICTFTPLISLPPPDDTIPATLMISGGNLTPAGMAGDSCTFSITLDVANDASAGIYLNETSLISATVDGATRIGDAATDTLEVISAPSLSKDFTDDPVTSGSSVTLEFTLTHSEEASGDATNITFTDDLGATLPVLTGLVAIGLPLNNVCGLGSSISGTSLLTFTGGSLVPGEVCSFSVTLDVPVSASSGNYTNTTSLVGATVLGLSTSSNFAEDDLLVANVLFTKEFLDDPVIPGGTSILRFTIDNSQNSFDISGFTFNDALNSVLLGLAAVMPLPAVPCGTGSSITGTNNLNFSGGNLLAGEMCTFDVLVQIPVSAATGNYINSTGLNFVSIDGNPVFLAPAIDILEVSSELLLFSKSFTDDPVAPGDAVTLEFTIDNLDTVNAVSAISFTDDLDSILTGLVATGLPFAACGGTVDGIPNAGTIDLSGGNLLAGASCTFSVILQVPVTASSSTVSNITSEVTGIINALAVNGTPATDDLIIDLVTFNKSFDGPSTATGAPVLTYTITNLEAAFGVSDLSFADDLDSVITGLVATGLPFNDSCGIGSMVTGTSLVAFSGGSLPASGMCSFDINLLVPVTATAGTHPSISSNLSIIGLPVSTPAAADLVIEPAPLFAKSFAPNSIGLGFSTTLSFTIDNTASVLPVNNIGMIDNLPAGVILATPPMASTTCGGTLTAVSGAGVVSLANGSVAAGASCTFQVTVVGTTSGTFLNLTGDLTSSSGNSGTASNTLVVNPQPGFSKSFAPNSIFIGGVSTLTFSIDNSASTVAASAINFVDNLPVGVVISTPANAGTTCTGGNITSVSGASTITYASGSVNMGSSCTISVDVTSNMAGSFVNTTGNLTSSLGNSGMASDTLLVNPPPLFSKIFNPDVIIQNGVSTLSFTIDNSNSTVNATGLDFTDNLPVAITIATPSNATTSCTGGTLTAVSGTSVVSYSSGIVNAGLTCGITVDVTSSILGTHMNLTGDLTSNHGNSGSASDNLLVTAIPLFSKSFTNNPYILNSANVLTFTINNTANVIDVASLGFTDVMPVGFTVANPANISNNCTGGTVTAVVASNTISYSGGTVLAGNSCNISVDVSASMVGQFTNTTSVLSTELGDGGVATAMIDINPALGFSKIFSPDIISIGGISTLTFDIDNTSSTNDATAINFTDNLPTSLTIANPANIVSSCGGAVTANSGGTVVSLSASLVTTGSTCAISVDVTSATAGTYVNTTGDLTSNLGNSGTASDTLIVTDLPVFTKAFAAASTTVNAVNTLTFTIDNSSSNNAITGLNFVDNMPASLIIANPANIVDNCTAGTVSAVVASNVISYTGGTIAANTTCTILVDVTATASGVFTNTTSALMTDIGNSNQAITDVTIVTPPLFSKSFLPSIISPGGVSTLSFDIDNNANQITIGNFSVVDNLPAGMTVAVTPNVSSTCISNTIVATANSGSITVTNGSVAASSSCQINVDITSLTSGFYTNITGDFTSDAGNSGTATADLNVTGGIMFNKSYSGLVAPDGNVTLSFVLENNTNTDANNISFSDDLSAVIVANAINLPLNDVCGVGSQVVGLAGGFVQLTGGVLAVGASCQIDLTVQIGVSVLPGIYTNTTSPLSADFNTNTIITAPVSDDFTVVAAPVLTKSFVGGAITAGDTVDLTFNLNNNSPLQATQISFSDNLDAFIIGATVLNLPQNDVCGFGSSLTGTSAIVFQNGVLPANSSCQFIVTIAVPNNTSTNVYTNVTSIVTADYNGFAVSGSASAIASDTLVVNGFMVSVPILADWILLTLLIIMILVAANVFYYRQPKIL